MHDNSLIDWYKSSFSKQPVSCSKPNEFKAGRAMLFIGGPPVHMNCIFHICKYAIDLYAYLYIIRTQTSNIQVYIEQQ